MNVPALQRTVLDLIDEYDEKNSAIDAEITAFNAAYTKLEMASSIQGKYVGSITRHKPYVSAGDLRTNLLKSGWKAIYDRLQIDMIAPANDKRKFERAIEDPAPLTYENARATFGDYLQRPRFHILRGLAEVFVDLDPAYKSHSKVKIGVSGLPKRLILQNVGGWGSYGRDRLRDILNALAAYQGIPHLDNDELGAVDKFHSYGNGHSFGAVALDGNHVVRKEEERSAPNRDISIRKFQNGNAHVIFGKAALLDINRALAEFYGEVLPDAEEEGVKPRASTAVAKDLQFYPSPKAVMDEILDAVGLYVPREWEGGRKLPARVLEPSCGDGRILDEVRLRGAHGYGIEVHASRAIEARAKGHPVKTANFLDYPPSAEFDFVVMNPPFSGRHYLKHVRHAEKFLKPGGTLIAVLPATAWYDHKELEGSWHDLPVASFAESGTNIPTGYLRIHKRVSA